MTLEQFQKKISSANWYEKYFWYILFLAATFGGLFFLYDVIAHHEKYDKTGGEYLGYFSFAFLTTLGLSGLFFVPNRYKVITTSSPISLDKKRQIINGVLKEFGDQSCDIDQDFYEFTYRKNWWTSYTIYLSFDQVNFYTSVQLVTRAFPGAMGIIDLGGTERVRKKVIDRLNSVITRH